MSGEEVEVFGDLVAIGGVAAFGVRQGGHGAVKLGCGGFDSESCGFSDRPGLAGTDRLGWISQ
ncbi:hypothetical protein L0A91_07035 [Ornithinimicrobium sp. INDO-MA30-4]|nr:hypothetical protein [Ornithinimicrobium sp. INDO-MA30-4]UJH71453.1 hypothetical protein L0A91_07035 [Ornithinimicrobium sp. INDO-MA30-4]